MSLTRLLRVEWDVVAGVIAAVLAMVFHVMGIASDDLARGVQLVLLALLLLRDLRQEGRTRQLADAVQSIDRRVGEEGESEALVGILEEPFAAQAAAASMPRYVLRIQNDSELLAHVVDLARHALNTFESGHELALRPEELLRAPPVG